jgi:hypothetical protein
MVTVDVNFAKDESVALDGHDNLRPGFEAASEITRVGANIVHNDRLAGGGCRAQMPWSSGMWV